MKSHRSYSDHEIAHYVLGLDSPEHAQDIQARLAQDDAAAACALKWEAYFLGIVDALPSAPPPATVLAGIQASLGIIEDAPADTAPASGRPSHEAPEATSDTATTPAPARPRRAWRSGRKQAVVAGVAAVVIILVVLVLSASLHHTSSTVVQQTIDLDAQ